jgi:hypothetical protein
MKKKSIPFRPEVYGIQEKCLHEIARTARLATEVRSYDDFCNNIMPTV